MNNSYNKITGEAITPAEDFVKVEEKILERFAGKDNLDDIHSQIELIKALRKMGKSPTEIYCDYRDKFTKAEIRRICNEADNEKAFDKLPGEQYQAYKGNVEKELLFDISHCLAGVVYNKEIADYLYGRKIDIALQEHLDPYRSADMKAEASYKLVDLFRKLYMQNGDCYRPLEELLELADSEINYGKTETAINPMKDTVHRLLYDIINEYDYDKTLCLQYIDECLYYSKFAFYQVDFVKELINGNMNYDYYLNSYQQLKGLFTEHLVQVNKVQCGSDWTFEPFEQLRFPTFDSTINEYTDGGFCGGNVNTFMGTSGTGKTTWAINQICYLAKQQIPSYYISLGGDIKDNEFEAKVAACLSELNYKQITQASDKEHSKNLQRLYQEELKYIHKVRYGGYEKTIEELLQNYRDYEILCREKGFEVPKFIVIDYDGLIACDSTEVYIKDQHIYQYAQNFAEGHNVCIVFITQGVKDAGRQIQTAEDLSTDLISGGRAKTEMSAVSLMFCREKDELCENKPYSKIGIKVVKTRFGTGTGKTTTEWFYGSRQRFYTSADEITPYDKIDYNVRLNEEQNCGVFI